jgi:hypothetical protein
MSVAPRGAQLPRGSWFAQGVTDVKHISAVFLLVGAGFIVAQPQHAAAGPRDFFDSLWPRNSVGEYLPDGAYIMDEADYYRYLKRKRMKRRAIEESYYEPDYDADRDAVYGEPRRVKRKAVNAPPPKTVIKQQPAKKKPAAVVSTKPAPKTVTATKPKSIEANPVVTGSTAAAASASGMSCAKATQIVTGYGFDSVSPQACNGKVYAFNAQRGGKAFVVRVDAGSGELTEVKKVQ